MTTYYYYIQVGEDPGTIYPMDTNAISFNAPGMSRNYNQVPLFNDGAMIVGQGNMIAGSITFEKMFRAGQDDATAWNKLRQDVMTLMATPKYTPVWFYIVDSAGKTMRTRIYPISTGGEGYSTFRISNMVSFTLLMETGYFEAVDYTKYSLTLTGTTLTQLYIYNNGSLAVSPLFTFTAGAGLSVIQVSMAVGYGFRLEYAFNSSDVITFDCATGTVEINGSAVDNLITAGGPFQIPAGETILNITAAAGTFDVAFKERLI